MIALSDVVVVAFIGAVASIIAAGLGLAGIVLARGNHRLSTDARDELKAELSTGNGHTSGTGIARLEAGQFQIKTMLDGALVQLSEHGQRLDVIEREVRTPDDS